MMRTLVAAVLLTSSLEAFAESPAVGAVEVDTQPPGETVLLDGQPAGVTPLLLPVVSAGTHHVEVAAPSGGTRSWEVVVQRGLTVRIADPVKHVEQAAPKPTKPEWLTPSVTTGLRVTAWIAAGVALGALVLAGLLWTATDREAPIRGALPPDVEGNLASSGSVVLLGIAGAAALVALVCAAAPATSFASM